MSDATRPDLPREFVIRESTHRIHDPFLPEKLARLGEALRLEAGATVLDLASGSGEMLCTWARDHRVHGVGVDLSSAFTETARARAVDLGVTGQVHFEHADASGWVADQPVDVASCLGATWISDGVAGTIALLERSLKPGGMVLIGEPFWLTVPESVEVARQAHAASIEEWTTLPELLASFATLGWDLVQMVLAGPDDWDACHAAQWLSTRRWLDQNPDDELAPRMRADLEAAPLDHLVTRALLGWGVFVLVRRP